MTKGQEKELAIYNFIKGSIEKGGTVPSMREICRAVGLSSPSSAYNYIRSLERQGKIVYEKGKKRAITLPGISDRNISYVPVIGAVTAGMPILAFEQDLGTVPFEMQRSYSGELFALKVKGDSMINAAILDGDTVIVEKTQVCSNGEIVVALIDDEATVKRFYKENGHFRLQPENDDYDPIITDHVAVLGRVVSVIRYY